MLERLIADAHVADHERYARKHEQARKARKLFPRAPKKRTEREPINMPVRNEPRPGPLYY